MEQGSYLLIEPGMTVQGMDAELGSVAQVVADAGVDVFRGILITHGFLPPRQSFVSEEYIVSVIGDVVRVNLSKTDAEALPPTAAASTASTG